MPVLDGALPIARFMNSRSGPPRALRSQVRDRRRECSRLAMDIKHCKKVTYRGPRAGSGTAWTQRSSYSRFVARRGDATDSREPALPLPSVPCALVSGTAACVGVCIWSETSSSPHLFLSFSSHTKRCLYASDVRSSTWSCMRLSISMRLRIDLMMAACRGLSRVLWRQRRLDRI